MATVRRIKATTEYKFIDWRQEKKLPKPDEIVQASLPWVKWGKKNDYPLLINTLYEKSPSQTGIINGKVYYMTSGGWTITPTVEAADVALKIRDFEANGASDYSLMDVYLACVKDWELYNGWCFRGVWNPLTGRPSFIEPVDFDQIRTNEEGNRFFYSEDWTTDRQSKETTGFREIPEYNPNHKIGEFLIYVSHSKKKTEKGLVKVYPTPPYSGCVESLATEIEMQSFHFYETQNGFKSGTVLHLPSAKPKSKGERELLAGKIRKEGTDRETAGGVVVLFGEGGTDKPTVLQLYGNDLDKRYLQTETSVANTILRAHAIGTPSLFGMLVPGQLGNTQELINGFNIFVATYVKSRQKTFNDTFTWYLNTVLGIPAKFEAQAPPPIVSEAPKPQFKITAAPDSDEFKYADPEERSVLKALAKAGRNRSRYVVKESKGVPVQCDASWFDTSEAELLEAVRSERHFFATILTELQKNVLALINDGQDASSIAKALDRSIQQVMDAYNELSGKGLVKKNGELSELGKRYLDAQEIPAASFEIRYSYELRPDAPPLKSKKKGGTGESRPFCKKLMSMDKLYTRQEIEAISAAIGRDVWSYRGGWYHNPEKNQNTPFCRHTWYQHVVVKK